MNINSKLKIMAIATLVAVSCEQADARRLHRNHIPHYPARVVVIPTPAQHNVVTKHVSNRFSQKERLAMALAYLNNNQRLSVKQYAKITSRSTRMRQRQSSMPLCWIEIFLSYQ